MDVRRIRKLIDSVEVQVELSLQVVSGPNLSRDKLLPSYAPHINLTLFMRHEGKGSYIGGVFCPSSPISITLSFIESNTFILY
ncbi:hypothetical protein VNO78_26548 [Psophocarpus tetragonolobus]|uniref:Uncharacterized protein n=1 Tax=Psophocarpus tetragonolobus TaxID=3891 RepID=A0AAN9S006_PSOTE